MNDRQDFEPDIRNASWWASDSRQAANGRGNDVVLTKLGLKTPPDLSDVEAVQMGHVMQPLIGRLAQDRLKMELKNADYMLTHPKEVWMRSHFDFISADGKTLVEAKNYNAIVRNKYDSDANIVPAADMAQLIHQSACHGIDHVVLAVLFGGQNFETFTFDITDDQRTDLIKDMALYWGAVQTGQPLEPETVAQAKLVYAVDNGSRVSAGSNVEKAVTQLKSIKKQIKELELAEEQYQLAIQNYMKTGSELVSVGGTILATWKQAKASERFNASLFEAAMPDIYDSFVVAQPGSRRFIVK